jgi:predicted outer membrane lipoprotein
MIFGVGGAILGLILYSAFGIITGLEIGYLPLAVGYIVGKAVGMGSGGVGGRRYQIAAQTSLRSPHPKLLPSTHPYSRGWL